MSWPDRERHLEIIFWRRGLGRPVHVYRDPADWWIGYYRSEDQHYVCIVPTVVIRWARRPRGGESQ